MNFFLFVLDKCFYNILFLCVLYSMYCNFVTLYFLCYIIYIYVYNMIDFEGCACLDTEEEHLKIRLLL